MATYSRAVAMLILRICDLCDPEALESADSTGMSFDGVDYEVDLCAVHRKELEDKAARYIAAGRRVRPEPAKRGRRAS